MQTYLDLMNRILLEGEDRQNRTGIPTRSLFGAQMRFDLTQGFPLLTTKRVFWKGIVHELLWLISGSTDVKELQKAGVHIWDEWVKEDGTIGSCYGKQWRAFSGIGPLEKALTETKEAPPTQAIVKQALKRIQDHPEARRLLILDQLSEALRLIKEDPQSRRIIVSAWNPIDLPDMALAPCHALFQFYVHQPKKGEKKGGLSCHLYQRSGDFFLGVPFNIASYSLLTHLIAQVSGLEPREFIHSFGDVHLYHNHFDQAREQLSRDPRPLPRLKLNPQVDSLFDFRFEDITLENYHPHPPIKGEVAV